ncbi:hypothetical protein FQZ97_995220 [compost metagenome]
MVQRLPRRSPASKHYRDEIQRLLFKAVPPAKLKLAAQQFGEGIAGQVLQQLDDPLLTLSACLPKCLSQGAVGVVGRLKRLDREALILLGQSHYMITIIGLVRQLIGGFIMVRGTNKPDIGWHPDLASLGQHRRCIGQRRFREADQALLRIVLLQRREELGKVLLRTRQVHLIQQDDVAGVLPTRRLRFV